MSENIKRLGAQVSEKTFREFKALCNLRGIRMEHMAGDLINDYVKSELPKYLAEKGYISGKDKGDIA